MPNHQDRSNLLHDARDLCQIGSARGKSACYIGLALKAQWSRKTLCVDPHTQTNWNDTDSVNTHSLMMKNIRRAGVTDLR